MRRAKRRAGYTLIEVLMAMGVLAAGSVAILGMHQAATRGNMASREVTTANVVAQQWVERLRRDALHWTRSGVAGDPTLLGGTAHLDQVGTQWFVPESNPALGETANFDFYGRDLTAGAAPHYCTNVRLAWLFPGKSMRADVRVWWVRRSNGAGGAADLANCAPGVAPDALTNNPDVRMVYTSTILRFTPPPS